MGREQSGSFQDLWQVKDLGEQRAKFRELIRSVCGNPEQPRASASYLLVAAACWSLSDLEFLDACIERHEHLRIIDIDELPSSEDFEQAFPGCKAPTSTPMLVEYVDGQARHQIEGKKAWEWLSAGGE